MGEEGALASVQSGFRFGDGRALLVEHWVDTEVADEVLDAGCVDLGGGSLVIAGGEVGEVQQLVSVEESPVQLWRFWRMVRGGGVVEVMSWLGWSGSSTGRIRVSLCRCSIWVQLWQPVIARRAAFYAV